ncbi:MAG TPA: hypothetical protein V6C76_02965 [Drouetiella sp.]
MTETTLLTKQSGFENLLNERANMHQWKHLKNLLTQGSNREAAAIVESFQKQMHVEQQLAQAVSSDN